MDLLETLFEAYEMSDAELVTRAVELGINTDSPSWQDVSNAVVDFSYLVNWNEHPFMEIRYDAEINVYVGYTKAEEEIINRFNKSIEECKND